METLKVSAPKPVRRLHPSPYGGQAAAAYAPTGSSNLATTLMTTLPAVIISLSMPPAYVMSKEEHSAVDRAFFKSIAIVAGPKFV